MKFKKTSVIGAVLSLTLVLAVTVAFASEPKQPDEDSTTQSGQPMPAWGLTSNSGNAVESFTINLDYLAKNLAQHVADGTMTQEEADRVLALARKFAQENQLHWTLPPDSGLVYEPFGPDNVYDPEFHIFFKDAEGNLTPLDPATVVGGFIFPASSEDHPVYADGVDDYAVNLPTLDEDGSWVAADGSVIGTRYELCTLEDCGVTDSHAHINGQVITVDYQDPYTDSTQPPSIIRVPSCGVEGCAIQGEHTHHSDSHGSGHHRNSRH